MTKQDIKAIITFLTVLLFIISMVMLFWAGYFFGKADAADFTIGTISYSQHWFETGEENYGRGFNEEHNGWFVGYNDYVAGEYLNSEFNQSSFLAWKPPVRDSEYFSWLIGAANGYDTVGVMPMLGVSAHYKIVYATITPGVGFAGLKIDF